MQNIWFETIQNLTEFSSLEQKPVVKMFVSKGAKHGIYKIVDVYGEACFSEKCLQIS